MRLRRHRVDARTVPIPIPTTTPPCDWPDCDRPADYVVGAQGCDGIAHHATLCDPHADDWDHHLFPRPATWQDKARALDAEREVAADPDGGQR